jgi:hypothetical protein
MLEQEGSVRVRRSEGAMGRPKHNGELGDTVFDGITTWLCLGGNEWVMKVSPESDALIRQRNLRDIEADDQS